MLKFAFKDVSTKNSEPTYSTLNHTFVFTFDVFFSAETTMHCKVTCILYKKQAHFSQLFCLQVDQWLHDSFMERKQDYNVTSVKNVKVCF
jgi:hypothetical protein